MSLQAFDAILVFFYSLSSTSHDSCFTGYTCNAIPGKLQRWLIWCKSQHVLISIACTVVKMFHNIVLCKKLFFFY